MTEVSLQKKARLLDTKIKTLQRFDREEEVKDYLRGKELSAIKKRKYYLAYGDHIKTFEDFLKETTIDDRGTERLIVGCGRTKAYDLMKWYELNFDCPQRARGFHYAQWKRLLPYLTHENKAELLSMARGYRDHFEEVMRELKGKPTQDKCNHEDYKEKWIHLTKCPNCNKMWRIKKPQ
jgi:hypothetical protein